LYHIAASVDAPLPSFLNRLKLRLHGVQEKNAKQGRKSDLDLDDPLHEQEAGVYRRLAVYPDSSY
jgi:hypothetical protein